MYICFLRYLFVRFGHKQSRLKKFASRVSPDAGMRDERGHDLLSPEARVSGLMPRWATKAKDAGHLERAMRHDGAPADMPESAA
jgi:hypothetical protein